MNSSKLYKKKARNAVAYAIKNGTLSRPTHCSMCGKESEKIEAHHLSYDKPLEVTWLCFDCHRKVAHGNSGHYNRRFNDEQVSEIRQSTLSSYALAKKFSVSYSTIVKVKEHKGAYE